MKRDMDLIRDLLGQVEAIDADGSYLSVDDRLAVHQVSLMKDAGLVDANLLEDGNGLYNGANVFRLTWAGHDFLDAVREDTVWNKIKKNVIKPGASWTFAMVLEYAKMEIKQQIFKAQPPD